MKLAIPEHIVEAVDAERERKPPQCGRACRDWSAALGRCLRSGCDTEAAVYDALVRLAEGADDVCVGAGRIAEEAGLDAHMTAHYALGRLVDDGRICVVVPSSGTRPATYGVLS